MPIRRPEESRRSIRVGGEESIVDVARVVFKDPRLATLISDLNPGLPLKGPLAAGALVTVPSPSEAKAFARKMGFTLGFNEGGTNGTRQKRAWARLKGPGQASHAGIDPTEAARKLLDQSLPAAEVGRRLAALCTSEALARFLGQPPDDAALGPVWQAVELHTSLPKARARLLQLVGILEATMRPAGLLALVEALQADPPAAERVLKAALLPQAALEGLRAQAPRALTLVERTRQLAAMERGARDAELGRAPEPALRALLDAVVDRVPPLAGERLALLGLAEPWAAATAHLERLKEIVKKHEGLLERAGNEVVRAVAEARDGAKLPKPWPLVAAVVEGLAPALDAAPANGLDEGLGALVPRSPNASPQSRPASRPGLSMSGATARSMEGGPIISAASLQARAASGARSTDEGTAIAERLGARVAELLELARPLSGDTGPMAMRRARRRSHFDSLMLARSLPHGPAIAQHLDDILGDARRAKVQGADVLERPQQAGARDAAQRLTGTLTLRQQNVSELARALLVAAMALDRELGALLARPTGREAFRAAAEKHGTKLLSRAAMVYAEPQGS